MPHKVWAVGEEVLAADFQSYLQNQTVPQFPTVAARDAWLAPPKGALCVTTDTNTVWQYTGAAWALYFPNRPRAYAYRTTNYGVANGALTAIPLDGERYDARDMHVAGTPTRLTVPAGEAGIYLMSGGIAYTANGSGYRGLFFYVNGVLVAGDGYYGGNGVFQTHMDIEYERDLAAGDYVELTTYQNSGGVLNALATLTYLSLRWVAPL